MLLENIAVVTIGRNEGERLINCLRSLKEQLPTSAPIIYVDSGSTDDSIAQAEKLDVQVISLDLSIPFTAARGRNTGLAYILENHPQTEYIQFLDGDCQLVPNWLNQAVKHLAENTRLAIVCGRRREISPQHSLYNQLIDMEWNTPVGEATACGGDALIRLEALKQVNGYNPSLICGEEPEMCIRLRQKGWKIERLDLEMTLHDADISKFSQWWKRSLRGGWAVAQGYAMYGNKEEKYMKKQHTSGYLWGFIVPLLSLSLLLITKGFSLIFLSGYLLLAIKIFKYRQANFTGEQEKPELYAFWCVLSKFPQFLGQCQYWWKQWTNKTATIIEYK